MSAKTHTCEGCYEITETATKHQPEGWIGFGASRFPQQHIAVWCPSCAANGTMEREAQTTKAAAQFWHERRQQPLPDPPPR